MRVRPIVAWYDMWMGAYWDSIKRKLYILPIPCIGIVIDFTSGPFYLPNKPIDPKHYRNEF